MALSFTIRDIYYQTSIELLAKDDVKHEFNITISAEEAQKLKELDIELYNQNSDLNALMEKLDQMHKIFFKDDLEKIKGILFGINFDNFFDNLVLDYVNFTQGEMEKKLKKYQNTTSHSHLKR